MQGYLSWLEAPGRAATTRFDLPEPGDGDILVEVLRANICGSDLGIWRGTHASLQNPPLGHEFVGLILAMGEKVVTDRAGTPLAPGDRVVATYFPVCHTCKACSDGRFESCRRAYAYRGASVEQSPHFHGAFASHYYIHADQHVYRVPDTVSDEAAALANCGLATVLQGIDTLPAANGAVAAVLGLGGLGLMACATLAAAGWQVVGVDPLEDRRSVAHGFGAELTAGSLQEALKSGIADLGGLEGADAVIDVTGQPSLFAEAVEALAPRGTLVEMGTVDSGPHLTGSLTPSALVRRRLTLRGSFRYEPSRLNRALRFLADEGADLPFAALSPEPFPLSEVQEALRAAADRRQVRVALIPEGGTRA